MPARRTRPACRDQTNPRQSRAPCHAGAVTTSTTRHQDAPPEPGVTAATPCPLSHL